MISLQYPFPQSQMLIMLLVFDHPASHITTLGSNTTLTVKATQQLKATGVETVDQSINQAQSFTQNSQTTSDGVIEAVITTLTYNIKKIQEAMD